MEEGGVVPCEQTYGQTNVSLGIVSVSEPLDRLPFVNGVLEVMIYIV